jgi:delta24-sterol reductase
VKRGEPWDAEANVRAIEAFVRERAGFTLLWADIFMTRDEFEATFDHALYRRVRRRVGAEGAFPEVWDKVKPQRSLVAERP